MREDIRDFYGRIIGYLDKRPNGDVVAHDFYGRILGTYDKGLNATKDFYGRILTSGDTTSGLVLASKGKEGR